MIVAATDDKKKNSRYPDPLEISPVNPMDFRWENGKSIYEPGWWKNIPKDDCQTRRKKTSRGKRG